MRLAFLVGLCSLGLWSSTATAADENPVLVVDFAALGNATKETFLDYQFVCLDPVANARNNDTDYITGFCGITRFLPADGAVENLRDDLLKSCLKDGFDAEAEGKTKLVLRSLKGLPLQADKIKFKVTTDAKETSKGPFLPTVTVKAKKKES